MSEKSRKAKLSLLAYVALLLGAVGLILRFFNIALFGSFVDFLMFMLAAIVAYEITKDGKPFFSSFYKISYTVALIVVGVFIILPFAMDIISLISK